MDESEQAVIDGWRYDRLRELGLTHEQALELALRGDIDWHQVEALVHHGCRPELAAAIMT